MQGLPSSEIEIILLIIGRRAGVFVRNTLRPSVLGLTECHSWLSHFLSQGSIDEDIELNRAGSYDRSRRDELTQVQDSLEFRACSSHGGLAQLGERLHGMQEVRGSSPLSSIAAQPQSSRRAEKVVRREEQAPPALLRSTRYFLRSKRAIAAQPQSSRRAEKVVRREEQAPPALLRSTRYFLLSKRAIAAQPQ